MILFPAPPELLAAAYFSLVEQGKTPAPDGDMRPLLAEAEKHLVQFRDGLIIAMGNRTYGRLPSDRSLRLWPKVYDLMIEAGLDPVWLSPDDPIEAVGVPLVCAYGLASLRWLNWLARGRVPDYAELNSDYAADFIICRRYLEYASESRSPVQMRLL